MVKSVNLSSLYSLLSMNFNKIGLFLMTFAGTCVFGQSFIPESATTSSPIKKNTQAPTAPQSNIVSSSTADTAFLKLQLNGAVYDATKKNFPFYTVSQTTPYEQNASPSLVIKKTLPVAEPHASVIRRFFGAYLSSNYELKAVASLSRDENLNQHQLFPFRINAAQQVEELIDYDVTWQLSYNNNAASRLAAASAFTTTSVLASGSWFKIGVTKSGIYKIDKTFLLSMGIDINTLDPQKIRIYGNGGKMLPELNGAARYDDLVENAIQVSGESDGKFDDTDYVLFYATGPDEWKATNTKVAASLKFSVIKNLYSDTSFYFFNADLGSGKRVATQPASAGVPNISSTSYDYYNYHESDEINFVKSGRNFYGEYFDINNSYNFSWNDGDFVTGDTIRSEATVAARARTTTNFLVSGSGLNFGLSTFSVNVDYYLGDYADDATAPGFGLLSSGSGNIISVSVTKTTGNSLGWLDKLTINARRKLIVNNKQFQFRDTRTAGPAKICNFFIATSANPTLSVWNVTDPLNPFVQNYNSTGTGIDFTTPTAVLNEFCISPTTDFYTPKLVGQVANQNLHALQQADYVVITHPLFTSQAARIAKLHKDNEGLTYAIATIDQVYNEFSSGRPDISAIRDFIRMLYTRNTGSQKVKYALLIGDGSYKNNGRSLLNNSNLIPTYQSHNSLSPTLSLATDDFYALMDSTEGFNAESFGKVDIGVGRFTCRTTSEVNGVIAKIENYYRKDLSFDINNMTPENCNNLSESNMGDWRNWLIFVADDKDNALHMNDANKLTQDMELISPAFNIDKVFLDSYKSFSTPGGKRYPDATADFLKRINKGALVFNYTGHGGEGGLTEERILDVPTINALDNFNKLPLFVTATCEFSRYDDPDRTSAGELCLLNSKGGAIALFTTCRVAYSGPNYTLNDLLLRNLFKKINGNWPALGDVVRKTKATIGQSIYFANFHLLGDPAMPLACPQQKVFTSKINNVSVTPLSSDTLGSLAKMTISGYVSDTLGNKLTNFNGLVYSSVFDKKRTISCLLNDVESSTVPGSMVPFQFSTQKNILYRGKSQVSNGDFSFTFIVPKDISFAPGQGRISYYATNGQMDAAGFYTNVVVGGNSAKNVIVDNEGPKIGLYLNDKNFVNGGTTSEKPILYADLIDSSGINTAGNGIGHDISVILDASGNNPVLLNDYYESNLNSYQSGRVRYPFSGLSEGEHRLSFKVWDIQNNSNMAYADFIVAKSAELALKHVLNYPNPFTTHTQFFFEHNQACSPLNINIQIYTISGKVVKTIHKFVTCEGFRPEGIDWDGKDEYGDKLGRGVYIYKLAVSDTKNKKAEKIEKLVILN